MEVSGAPRKRLIATATGTHHCFAFFFSGSASGCCGGLWAERGMAAVRMLGAPSCLPGCTAAAPIICVRKKSETTGGKQRHNITTLTTEKEEVGHDAHASAACHWNHSGGFCTS